MVFANDFHMVLVLVAKQEQGGIERLMDIDYLDVILIRAREGA